MGRGPRLRRDYRDVPATTLSPDQPAGLAHHSRLREQGSLADDEVEVVG
jgi:hypothetical protein